MNLEKRGLYVRTYGCQMNEYDSQKLEKLLEKDFYPVTDPANAELILINTCSVRDKPEQKLYSLLGELKDLKQQHPNIMIGVGGCVAQQEGQNIVDKSTAVDFVFGTHNLSLVPSLVALRRQGLPPQVAIDYRDEWEELPLGYSENQKGVTALISISRGCNKNCTYCIVPTTRGPEVSRDPSEIEREVKIAVHRGAREVMLLGQTVNSYGLDLTPRLKFVQLLERLSQIEGLQRIRFTSPHPQEVRDDFIELVVSNPKVCRHIHMPLQSGSDAILKAMNRNYRRSRYLKIIQELRSQVPDIAITTDIIVGFPGETEKDFEDTLDVMEQTQFESSYSFVFSPRPGTAASTLPDPVVPQEKLERLHRLQAKQAHMTTSALSRWVGKKAEVLVEGPSTLDPHLMQGRISQNFVLNFEESDPKIKAGNLVEVMVTQASRYTLKGKPLESSIN